MSGHEQCIPDMCDICMEAVKQYGHSLQYINNPSEEVCIQALVTNFDALEKIKNPTEYVYLEAVKINGMCLKYIKNPTFEMCVIALANENFGNPKHFRIKHPCTWEKKLLLITDENMRKKCVEYFENIKFNKIKSARFN